MPPLLITPQPRDTLPRNSPLNPSHTNTVLPMTTLVPTSKRPKTKTPLVTSKAHTVSTFPTVAFKSSPTLLITTTASLLMSNTKVPPSTPKRNPTNPPPNTPLLPPSTPPLPPNTSQHKLS